VVYIREAHSTDGWALESGWSILADATDHDERKAAAAQACSMLRFPFKVAVDGMDDTVAIRWSAWPERLFVVDVDGIVRYTGEQGPFGFWPRRTTPPMVAEDEFNPGEPLDEFLEAFLSESAVKPDSP
jgi:hypothetical protein